MKIYNPLRVRSGAILLDIDQKESFENYGSPLVSGEKNILSGGITPYFSVNNTFFI